MVKVRENLVGQTFGKWTVLQQAEDWITPKGQHEACWLCECSCDSKTQKIVRGRNLKNNSSRSCGCLIFDNYYKSQKNDAGGFEKKYNDYEIQEDYVIMYTYKNEIILVDLEDFWKVKNISWTINAEGYVIGKKDGKKVSMHRMVTGESDGKLVDHKNGEKSRYDNRKGNLRIATSSLNQINKKKLPNKYSDVTGISWLEYAKKWRAYIGVNGKQIVLGHYDCFDDAVQARKRAEELYYQDWAYNKSQQADSWNI